jgi:hypothetical protein
MICFVSAHDFNHTLWSNDFFPTFRIIILSGYIDNLKRVGKDSRFVKLMYTYHFNLFQWSVLFALRLPVQVFIPVQKINKENDKFQQLLNMWRCMCYIGSQSNKTRFYNWHGKK